MARLPIKKFELPSLNRLLSKVVVDRFVLVLKFVCGILCVLMLVVIVKEVSATKTRLQTAVLELENAGKLDGTAARSSTKGATQDYTALISKSLLGAVDNGAPKATPTPAVKPASNIALTLIGTFVEAKHEPYAIIEDKKKSIQEVFNIGELIFNEAKLMKIDIDRVEIERNGQREVLVIDELTDSKPEMKGGVATLDNNQYVVDRGELDKALENLPLLLTQARAVPYFKDGVAVGLRLFAIKGDSMFEKLGMRNGDILKSVNGSNLGDVTQAVKLFETLKADGSLALKLERNMEEKEFKYEIR